jgi:polyhydroxyalkanoate synthase
MTQPAKESSAPSIQAVPSAPSAAAPAAAEPKPARRPLRVAPTPADLTEAPMLAGHGQTMDRFLHAALGRITLGLSPSSLLAAYMDWAVHLAMQPGKQMELLEKASRKFHRLLMYSLRAAGPQAVPTIEPLPQDQRFDHPAWQQWPFNIYFQSFLLTQQWWFNATTGIRGVTPHHEQVTTFAARQILDMFSPSNLPWTNPEVLMETARSGGSNLLQGMYNWWSDVERILANRPKEGRDAYRVGEDVAVTPGKVVFRNRLMELIQYSAATDSVYAEPVLIVPSWIMKYYILDLSPHNSFVRYLVEQGHTVFMISWKNPDTHDRDLDMGDYLRFGPLAAIDVVSRIVPERRINAVGYCLGGTLLAIAAAALAREDDERLNSVTLLATEVDFEEPGELGLFIDESQLAFLEDIMWDQGYLDGSQMAGAFELLNSKDLVWSRMVHDYLMGTRAPLSDLMAWNADLTRMPYRMHSEYLKRLYLGNELARGTYPVEERPVALTDIRVPIFAVGTVRDHVSPWRSVYKIHLLTDTEVTFLLTNGGHNAGIVSEPGHKGRSYQVGTQAAEDKYVDPDTWCARTPKQEGSWWPAWQGWLAAHSSERVPPRTPGSRDYPPMTDAPGCYVLQP